MDPDVFITKVVKPKKSIQWVASSFDDFANDSFSSLVSTRQKSATPSTSHAKKRPREQSSVKIFFSQEPVHRLTTCVKGKDKKLKAILNTDLWAEKFDPRNKAELAVHKKKVEEVETWLLRKCQDVYKHEAPILLMTGPAGAGKTATIHVLAKDLKCEVQEWTNPVVPSSDQFLPDAFNPYENSRVDVCRYESQLTQFKNFLLRANKYHSLDMFGSQSSNKKIIFVEELPNQCFRDIVAFHDILRKYRHVGRCPLVFALSDTTSGESNERLLFPADIRDELQIEAISFNPVAPTMMIKVLTRIANLALNQGASNFVPSSNVLESVAMSSAGDVRSAVNALQFACCQDTLDLKKILNSSKTKTKSSGRKLKYQTSLNKDTLCSAESGIGARDTTCFLFHAIGKILHCKREDPANVPSLPRLPPHLSEHDRDPLVIVPEDVIEKSHLSGDYFTSFLHQNYMDFFNHLSDVVRASEYISDADFFTAEWESRSIMQNYAVSIASRGVIHSNTDSARHNSQRVGPGWKPLHKSQWFSVQKKSRQNGQTACELFRGCHCEPEVLWTEIVPFMNLINITLHSPGQISFVQEMGRFTRHGQSTKSEKLDEKDVVSLEEAETCSVPLTNEKSSVSSTSYDDDFITNSQNEIKVQPEEEEEIIIEDFDD
ncbi:cell cycle checkpoint protein RAD17-like [Gigantopelta aegis]|uniref:cell cycle checkpoint protein RAD17-like n=1 Tax=Gigantopelta aegis TaxID=1735272 RepID=UPI001B88A204|nr:cell cycle checkpoint protein RAD17-like [Gigantopelta aegis]XP_041358275.1 cell cycle checkpoint protein RAD17-like [Gigantopelta aegis]